MREIKFRAWGKAYEEDELKMRYSDEYPDMGAFWTLCIGQWTRKPHQEELMQYTGLKDKNGKEIYESDILNNGDIGSTNWIVTWNEKGFYSYCDDEVCEDSPMSHLEHLEIIGNIYENPNLIK